MSLKAFHVVFIICSLWLLLGFAYWGVSSYRGSGDGSALTMGVLSVGATVLLGFYGAWFLKKLRTEDGLR